MGKVWIYDTMRSLWYNQRLPTETSKTYPGKPAPPKAKKVSAAKKTTSTSTDTELPTPFTVSGGLKWSRVAIRRLGRSRGSDGFGNARAVRNLFDLALKRQSARLSAQHSN